MRNVERRQVSAVRLREYHAAIQVLEAMTDAEYMELWVASLGAVPDAMWVPREARLTELKTWAIEESKRLLVALNMAA